MRINSSRMSAARAQSGVASVGGGSRNRGRGTTPPGRGQAGGPPSPRLSELPRRYIVTMPTSKYKHKRSGQTPTPSRQSNSSR
jgi:hypothetical protein